MTFCVSDAADRRPAYVGRDVAVQVASCVTAAAVILLICLHCSSHCAVASSRKHRSSARCHWCTRWARKLHTKLVTVILSVLNRSSLRDSHSTFTVKWLSWVQPHLAYVATLPCETFMPENKQLTIKLQGSVATYVLKVWWGCHNISSSSFSSVVARRTKCTRRPHSCLLLLPNIHRFY